MARTSIAWIDFKGYFHTSKQNRDIFKAVKLCIDLWSVRLTFPQPIILNGFKTQNQIDRLLRERSKAYLTIKNPLNHVNLDAQHGLRIVF